MAACHAKNFVDLGMIVDEVIDSVSPGSTPAIRLEKGIDDDGRLEFIRKNHGTPIDHQRPAPMVGYDAVVGETMQIRFSRPHHLAHDLDGRPVFDEFSGVVFDLILDGHVMSAVGASI
jgi:hypothetical protein